jgi:ATP-dependent RNA helicase RhlB
VRQKLYHVENDHKIGLLIAVLREQQATRTLIFVNTKRTAETITAYLEGNGIQAAVISGDIPQNQREKLLEDFEAGTLPVMVATDVAARGLHIPDVSHVINFDLPQEAEDYVHRIGRTARAGAAGDAISFACESYVYSLPDIESYIDQKIPAEMATEEMIETDIKPPKKRESPTRKRSGGGKGGGQSNRGGSPQGKPKRQQASETEASQEESD